MQSYNGRLYAGLTADSAVMPDAQKMRAFLEEAYAEVARGGGREAASSLKPRHPRRPLCRGAAPTAAEQ